MLNKVGREIICKFLKTNNKGRRVGKKVVTKMEHRKLLGSESMYFKRYVLAARE